MNSYLEIDNETLVRECIEGNTDALSLFYTRFAPRMYSVIMRYVSDPNDAKDILHDGFLLAFTRLRSLRDPDSVDYWLATIMKNLSLQFLQAQDVDKVLHDIPEVEDTPEFDDIIDLPVLEMLIKKLPKGYQAVFRLSVLENKTHKEIAKILGIAPNSSSSQLFHAKMMMRKLVSEYRHKAELLSLLLLLSVAGVFWWQFNGNSKSPELLNQPGSNLSGGTASVRKDVSEATDMTPVQPEENGVAEESCAPSMPDLISKSTSTSKRHTAALTETETIELPTEEEEEVDVGYTGNIASAPVLPEDDPIVQDTIHGAILNAIPIDDLIAYNDGYPASHSSRSGGWSFKIGVIAGISSDDFSSGEADLSKPIFGDSSEPHPGEQEEEKILSRAEYDFQEVSHYNDLPVTVSASISKFFSGCIGLETGLTYTYLHTTLESGALTSDCRWHYLGIPLKVIVNNYSSRRVRLYAAAGVQLDLPLSSFATTPYYGSGLPLPKGSFHSSAVFSVAVSYGINLNISDHVGVFFEPSLQYHFDHDYQVPNAWTDDKMMFSIPIGFRFNF